MVSAVSEGYFGNSADLLTRDPDVYEFLIFWLADLRCQIFLLLILLCCCSLIIT